MKPKKKALKNLTNLLFELGMLKKIEHCGTKFAGVKHPDTLGEHTCRAAQIGLIIAFEENGDPARVSMMCLVHDIGEIRIGDTHRIADKYIQTKKGEKKAMEDQTENLFPAARDKIRALWSEYHEQKTLDAKIARDADLLDTVFQAKEYMDTGFKSANRWLINAHKYLKTKTARNIFDEMLRTNFSDWWSDLNTV